MSEKDSISKKRISVLETQIEKGLKSFLEVGFALAEIKDKKLYKQLGYKSFERYCIERWGFKRTYAFSQIKAAAVVQNLSDKTFANGEHFQNLPAPQNERQVRPLIGLSPEIQRTIWTEAAKVARNPTGKVVKEVKEKIMKEISSDLNTNNQQLSVQREIGDICIIQAGDLSALKPYQGFWCVIKAKSDQVFDIDVFDRTLTLVKAEYLLKLECSQEQKDAGILLMSRMQRIASVETVSFLINSCLITLSKGRDFILPDRDREILYFIENRLGIISN